MAYVGHCADCGKDIGRNDMWVVDALSFCHECGREHREGF